MKIIRLVFLTAIAVIVILAGLRFLETLSLDKFKKPRPDVKMASAESPAGEDVDTGKFPLGFDGARWNMTLKEVMEIVQKEGKKIDTSGDSWTASAYDCKAEGEIIGQPAKIYYYFSNIGEIHQQDERHSSLLQNQDKFIRLVGIKIHWPIISNAFYTIAFREGNLNKLKETLYKKYGDPLQKFGNYSIWFYPNFGSKDIWYRIRDGLGLEDAFSCGVAIVFDYEEKWIGPEGHEVKGYDVYVKYFAPPLLYQKLRKSYEGWRSELIRKQKEEKEREFKERF